MQNDVFNFTLVRGEKVVHALIRQAAHDEQFAVGSKVKYGSGPKWTVLRKEAVR